MPMEKIKNVLEKYVNASAVFMSPLMVDYKRVVNVDKDGNEIISYLPIDGASLVQSNGKFLAWSLNSLLSAGVNPNFSITTGYSTRLDGLDLLVDVSAQINQMLDSVIDSSNDDSKE